MRAHSRLPPRIFDTHCHLQKLRRNQGDATAVIHRALAANCRGMCCVGVDLKTSHDAKRVCDDFYATIPSLSPCAHSDSNPILLHWSAGLHPVSANSFRAEFGGITELAEENNDKTAPNTKPRCVAIGETGIDFYRDGQPSREQQRESFVAHLELGKRLDLPIIIHGRSGNFGGDAYDEVISILKEHPESRGVIHCFSGEVRHAEKFAADFRNNWKVSFPCTVGYKNAGVLRTCAEMLPIEQITCETDAPWLSPQHMRGKANEPAFVHEALNVLARCRAKSTTEFAGLPFEEVREKVAEQLWKNSLDLYGL